MTCEEKLLDCRRMSLGFEMVTDDILKPSNLSILTQFGLLFYVLTDVMCLSSSKAK